MLRVVGNTYLVPVELLEKVAKAAFSCLELDNVEIELKFVTTREITRLNSLYRDRQGPTDVLSFTLDKKPLLGQIFICYTLTSTQAKRLQKDFSDEVALLLVHGILHICGYDHMAPLEEKNMQEMEHKILNKVGIQR